MARTTRQVSPSTAKRARVGRTRPASAQTATRRRRDARAELIGQLERAFEQGPELSGRHRDNEWAIHCLQTVRGFKPAPPPMSPADQLRLAETQADRIVSAIMAVLVGLGLSEEDQERGRKLAADALRAVSVQGWSPL